MQEARRPVGDSIDPDDCKSVHQGELKYVGGSPTALPGLTIPDGQNDIAARQHVHADRLKARICAP